MANSPSGESILGRTMRILQAFDAENPRLTASEIARRTGLPSSTAHRLAKDMVEAGFLDRLVDGCFTVSPMAWEISARSSAVERFRMLANPVLEKLNRDLGMYVSLTIPDFVERSVVHIHRIHADEPVVIIGDHATRLDLHITTTGMVMLAHAAPKIIEEVCSRPFVHSGTGAVTQAKEVRAELPEIRRDGYTYMIGGMVPGNTACAAPVFSSTKRVMGAVGVVTLTERAEPRQIIDATIQAAQEVTDGLKKVSLDL
ncbi:IclR family transcriptional regulator [Corynebacterium riegelii]|uniref:IclR family transcriptional regulator n=1 Tax=Corynebacterium riegelii TaxID=156976 RepID=UPI0023F4D3D7|nr:IclR family transcriptional regulator [Corynebacterium riegelii]